MDKIYYSSRELAERWGMSEGSIHKKRADGSGPVHTKLDGAIRYHINDIEAYEEERRANG